MVIVNSLGVWVILVIMVVFKLKGDVGKVICLEMKCLLLFVSMVMKWLLMMLDVVLVIIVLMIWKVF